MIKLIKEFVNDCVNQSNVNSLVIVMFLILIFSKENNDYKALITGGIYLISLILIWGIIKFVKRNKKVKV